MSRHKLPVGVIDFFDRTTRKINHIYRPAWLLNELESSTWVVDSGVVVRNVDGTIKGGVRLNWNRLLPSGSFTSPVYAVPLEQAKMIVVCAYDGALKVARSLRGILHFHLYLLWLAADSTTLGHPARAHLDTRSTRTWTPDPRPLGQAVGAQRRRVALLV
ncbi:hypothetical protein AO935_32295 [Pseudomonas aeruginosa]|nr:hypothetical protein AO935_32295 [Pseudomonas aeruginosa]